MNSSGKVMDLSPFMHALAALLVQFLCGLKWDRWGTGGALGSLWFIAREQTQAEYRWIALFGHGKRANMPWWGGFDWQVWNVASLLDWLVPVVACTLIWLLSRSMRQKRANIPQL